jgi:hypothetical protein
VTRFAVVLKQEAGNRPVIWNTEGYIDGPHNWLAACGPCAASCIALFYETNFVELITKQFTDVAEAES